MPSYLKADLSDNTTPSDYNWLDSSIKSVSITNYLLTYCLAGAFSYNTMILAYYYTGY